MHPINKRIAPFVAAAIVGLFSSVSLALEPTPFTAVYQARYNGLPIGAKGIRELKRFEDGSWQLTSSAKNFLASVVEQTRFNLNAFTDVVPTEYQYHRRGIGRNRTAILTFDWDEMEVLNDVQSQPWRMDIPEGTQDKLSYQLKMRHDLYRAWQRGEAWPELHYQIADGGHLKEYTFRVIGQERVETPAGTFNAVKATRVRDDDERVTHFWMVPEYEFMLVRFEQQEKDGDGFKLMLKEASFGGEAVTSNVP